MTGRPHEAGAGPALPPCGAFPGAGGVTFTVWAPEIGSVALHVEGESEARQMAPDTSGYHHLTAPDLGPGTRYRYALDGGVPLPDPASRAQPGGVHGPSEVIDLGAHRWGDGDFECRPLAEQVIIEVHIGALTEAGTFDAAIGALDGLVSIGIGAVEIMPVAQFPGVRNWGYDGVFPFAVQNSYGGAAGLQRFVDACHQRGLGAILDVVYNHVGPEGNVLPSFGPYFTERYATPWGAAVNFDGPRSDDVRSYFEQNARQWLEDFHIDGLRLDAVHEFIDRTAVPFLADLSQAVAEVAARTGRRPFLIGESADNDPRLTTGRRTGGLGIDAQWNDDAHHAIHAAVTGDQSGYYVDYGTVAQVATALSSDFVLAGQYSRFRQRRHGAPVGDLPHDHFVHFISNHDHIGNRPDGERLSTLVSFEQLRVAVAILLLAPGVPLLFMGDEYGETAPFPYFVDHGDSELLESVRRGRNAEFAQLGVGESRYDPGSQAAFEAALLDPSLRHKGDHRHLLALHARLIELRRSAPALGATDRTSTSAGAVGSVLWLRRQHPRQRVVAFFNLSDTASQAVLPELGASVSWSHLVGSGDPELGRPLDDGPPLAAGGDRVPMPRWSFRAYQSGEAPA